MTILGVNSAMSIIETTTSVIKTEPAEDTSIDSTEPPETKEEDTDGVTVKQEPIEEEDFQPSNTSNHSERVEVQVKVDPDSVVVDHSKPSRRKRKQVMNETRTELEQEESNAQVWAQTYFLQKSIARAPLIWIFE